MDTPACDAGGGDTGRHPAQCDQTPATGYFPSGHTATATVAYGTATLLLLPLLGSPAVRRGLIALCALLVLGASYGLVRRGYHWPLDVVGSWCLGTMLLTGVVLVSRSSRRTSVGTPSRRSGPS
ncbi:phosphatase PAP2 family protein [Streptomyces sp. E1N211]|uniref:phosphatase PAP2 family protein n=1 Tax=Streptomyces sp. E1N211 TaxID=1851876 RepID=UPI001F4D6B5E